MKKSICLVILLIVLNFAPKHTISDPIGPVSHASSNNLDWMASHANFESESENCFNPRHISTIALRNITSSDSSEMLKQFQYEGCKGIPAVTYDQLRMMRCCNDLKEERSSELEEPSFGLYGQACSNINILSLTQRICQELEKNDPKYHSKFKEIFSSKDFKLILGQISYIEFQKAMVSIVMQHIWLIISEVEQELGWQFMREDDHGRDSIDRVSDCIMYR